MQLDGNEIVDASEKGEWSNAAHWVLVDWCVVKGNMARYINHSCDPNCTLERWLVDGRVRLAVFAVKVDHSVDILKAVPDGVWLWTESGGWARNHGGL